MRHSRPYRPHQCLCSKNLRQNHCNHVQRCPTVAEYIGNVFLLGLTTLAGEVIDLQAANALNVLLTPFQNQSNNNQSQEILAGDVADNDVIDLLDGLL